MASGLLRHGLALRCGEVQRLGKTFGKACGIDRRGEPARLAMDNGFGSPAMIEGHDKPAHGLRLQRDPPERLRRDRRHGHDIRRHQRRRHVIHAVRQAEPPLKAKPDACLCQPVDEGLLAVGRPQKNTVEWPVGDLRQRLEQDFMTLPCRRPRRQHDHRLVFRQGNGVDEADDP